jgi:cell division protein FtsI (penicillin-binding protein 3)
MGLTERRIGLLFALFLALLVLAAGRTLWLGAVRADSLQRAAATQQVDNLDVPAQRGTITDRHGVELAVSEPAEDVAVSPYLVKSPLEAAHKLAPLIDLTEAEILRAFSRRDTGFVYLARKVSGSKADAIRKLKIAGMQFIPTSRREYPRRWLASQVLGGVGTEGRGLSGLEYSEQRTLGGTDGKRRIVKDALGEPITVQETERARAGQDIQLTIDAQLQDKVEDVLAQVGAVWRPKGATAVVMNPHNGAVLAIANWPRVDANDLGSAPAYASQDRAVGFNYEPGSTFKAFTVAGALEDNVVSPDDYFHLPPTIKVADRTIGEAHDRGAVDLTTSQILQQSSNVGTVRIGQRLGARRFANWVQRFGFGRKTGIALPGEESGQVLALNKYSGSSMGNLPIGQGNSVTPIQLATAYAAIANGGILLRPRIITSIGGKAMARPAGKRVVSGRTAAQIRTMLEGVLEAGGTASQAAIKGYSLAGKTGTANKIETEGPNKGEYSKTRFIASFAGFAPARRPKLLVTVMVDEPQGEIYGSEVAAPAFQEIMRFALPYLGIAPG